MGYCFAFSGGVGQFVSVNDLFSISLREISPLYLMFLAMPLGILYMRVRNGAWSRADAIAAIPEPELRVQEEEKRIKQYKKMHFYENLYAGIFIFSAVAAYVARGEFIYVFMAIGLGTFAINIAYTIANRLGVYAPEVYIYIMLLWLVAISLGWGMQHGASDQSRSYAVASKSFPTCGNFALLRPLSPNFLAVGRNNHHYLLDSNCKPLFRLNRPPRWKGVLGS